eukprot:CAMPEP_0178470742 /NCGR_PEP_ID=MMETSP0696-20121128/680_1 /TAXON_ID=265572 /ORGANISM="Extubocellulus spinifer, Strain CCMP396" /LENGTH=86 /DNA_ID=CAMNT_0020097847 /DNA_START=164 /DNA_END=425 /DNA_ORIENTATION=-
MKVEGTCSVKATDKMVGHNVEQSASDRQGVTSPFAAEDFMIGGLRATGTSRDVGTIQSLATIPSPPPGVMLSSTYGRLQVPWGCKI